MAVRGKNSLFFATGLDNTGLEKGIDEAASLVGGLSSRISKINPFAALAVGALAAFATIAGAAFNLAKEFETAMKEVQTISNAARADFKGIASEVFALSEVTPEEPKALAEAYYQIVSAGYDGAEGLALLETAAKAAVAGVTDTETAADGITTIMNAFRISMEDVDIVADRMFKTVELGKTTFDQIAASISQVAPLAASMGVGFEEVLAAVASLTKQGVPTAQAMTQIRAGLIGVGEVLGDGWAEAYTLQEAFAAVEEQAGGSQIKLREMVGTVEAVGAILGTTGKNAETAAQDLEDLAEAGGAVERAFRIQLNSNDNQWKIFSNRIKAATKNLGELTLEASTGLARTLNFMIKDFNRVSDSMEKNRIQMRSLQLELNNTNTSEERRRAILEQLKNQYPDYLSDLDSEKSTLEEINTALNNVNQNLLNRIALQLQQEDIEKEAERGANLRVQQEEKRRDLMEQIVKEAEKFNITVKQGATISETARNLADAIDKAKSLQGVREQNTAASSGLNQLANEYDNLAGSIENVQERVDKLINNKNEFALKYDIIPNQNVEGELSKAIKEKIAEVQKLNDISQLELYLQDGNESVKQAAQARITLLKNQKSQIEEEWKSYIDGLKAQEQAYRDYEKLISTLGEEEAQKFKEKLGVKEENWTTHLKKLYDETESTAKKIEIALIAATSGVQLERTPEVKVEEITRGVKQEVEIDIKVNPKSISEAERTISRLNELYENAEDQKTRDAISERIKQYEEWVRIARNESSEELNIRRDFFNSISDLRARDIRDQLQADRRRLKLLLKDEEKNAEEIRKLKQDISAEEEALANKAIQVGETVGRIFSDLSSLFATFGNEDLAGLMDQLQGVAEGAGQLAAGLAKGGNPLDIISGAAKILESAITIEIDSDTAKFEQAIKELRRTVDDLDYAISQSIGEDRFQNRVAAIDQLKELEEQAQLAEEAERKARKEVKFLGLTIGNKGAGSGTDPEKIRELQEAAEDARREVLALENEIDELFTGTTSDSIVNALIDGFAEGKKSAEDFAGTFEDLMKQAVLESLKIRFLEKAADSFFKDFADLAESGGGLDAGEIADLRSQFAELINQSNQELDALNQILNEAGIEGGVSSDVQRQGLSGEITTITEETASILSGTLNGIRVDVSQGLQVAEQANLILTEMSNTLLLLLEENKISNIRLQAIERNLT
jgi:TP901 family phage tail tape measure protein